MDNILLLPIFLLLSISSSAYKPCDANIDQSYVCNDARFASIGLNMSSFAFCDKTLPLDRRAKDLVDSMTLDEKVAQLGNTARGVQRLGLPPYEWWSEALHGVSNVGPGTKFNKDVPAATSFPTPILTTASFNETLWRTIGEVVSTEARAMRNVGKAGLTFWSPTMNVARDPRWGRITETPGECPFVVGRYVVNYVGGLQDVPGQEERSPFRPLKVSACCKHYTAYDVDAWLGVDRFHFDARVAERDLIETFNRPFEMCVKEGDVSSVMCSYNRINGIPSCADTRLLSDTIRGEWKLNGYIVSDCDSIEVMVDNHHWLNDKPEDAVRQVIRAGLDLDCGSFYPNYLKSAVEQGKVREGDIDKALNNLYIVLLRLGFFDGSPEFESLGKEDICSKDHMQLSIEAARQGIVLLKNDHNALPLDASKLQSVAVIGPHAEATAAMIGNYAGVPCKYTKPQDAFAKYTQVNFMRGCDGVACPNGDWIFHAVQMSQMSNATVIHVGLDLSVEAEGHDRVDLLLPGYQTQLINEVAAAADHPVILVIFSAGPVDVSFAQNNKKIGAIIWAGYPGEEGGVAIADVVFGKSNPGGRLPVTWYKNDYVKQLPMTSIQLRPDDTLGYPGRTYKFFNGSVLYPFGFGLSYTQFSYNLLSSVRSVVTKLNPVQHCHDIAYKPNAYVPSCKAVLVEDIGCDQTIDIEVEVNNIGSVDGGHVVMVYSIPPEPIVGAPLKQLIGFERVFVKAGSSTAAKFSINACEALSLVTETAYKVLPWGQHTISIGDGNGAITFPLRVNFEFYSD
ncbi:hypothetical protein ACLOJK_022008 [Asimina triloba]